MTLNPGFLTGLRNKRGSIDTCCMTVKKAALVATVGMALWTLLLTVDLFKIAAGILNGLLPSNTLFPALIQLLAALSLLVFFFVLQRSE
jgi:hypothetical protein